MFHIRCKEHGVLSHFVGQSIKSLYIIECIDPILRLLYIMGSFGYLAG